MYNMSIDGEHLKPSKLQNFFIFFLLTAFVMALYIFYSMILRADYFEILLAKIFV